MANTTGIRRSCLMRPAQESFDDDHDWMSRELALCCEWLCRDVLHTYLGEHGSFRDGGPHTPRSLFSRG
jgi:hypothetical protein